MSLFLSGFIVFTSCGGEEPILEEPILIEDPEPPTSPDPENPNPPGAIAVTSITLDYTNLTLVRKTSENLKATVLPENASNPTVTWTSSNNAIAEVDANGQVKAKTPGEVTIKAKAGDKTAECKVSVPNHDIYITGFQQLEAGTNPKNTARLWKNGELVNINQPQTKDALAYVFFMSGSNIYVVRNEKIANNNNAYATLWTNGTPTRYPMVPVTPWRETLCVSTAMCLLLDMTKEWHAIGKTERKQIYIQLLPARQIRFRMPR